MSGGPGSRTIAVPAEAMEAFLQSKGFARETFMGEVVYVRGSRRCAHTFIKVYTSLAVGATHSRECGTDAIRVVAIFSRATRPGARPFVKCITKETRVHRTGSVDKILARTLERIMGAVGEANAWLDDPSAGCFECRARAREAAKAAQTPNNSNQGDDR